VPVNTVVSIPEQKWRPSADSTIALAVPPSDSSCTRAGSPAKSGNHRIRPLGPDHSDVGDMVGHVDGEAGEIGRGGTLPG
jgi:hypothetical protein